MESLALFVGKHVSQFGDMVLFGSMVLRSANFFLIDCLFFSQLSSIDK